MDFSAFNHLSWFDQALVALMVALAVYALYSVFSLLWRVPEYVLAKKELVQAQTRYYEARTAQIKEMTR